MTLAISAGRRAAGNMNIAGGGRIARLAQLLGQGSDEVGVVHRRRGDNGAQPLTHRHIAVVRQQGNGLADGNAAGIVFGLEVRFGGQAFAGE